MLALLLLAAVAAAQPAAPVRVVLKDEAPYFNPKRLELPHGGTVEWENRGPSLIHTIVIRNAGGTIRSGSIQPGQTWSHTFAAGEDAVIKTACEVHPYMYGVVIVGRPSVSIAAASETTAAGATRPPMLEFTMPIADSVPGILAADAEDNIWIAMSGGGLKNIDLPTLHYVARLTIEGDVTVYPLPTRESAPDGLVVAPDGSIYISEYLGNRIARLDPAARTVEEFVIPSPNAKPTGLAVDADGALWFNENGAGKVARLDRRGVITEFPIPTPNSRPTGLAIDQRGVVWISERDAGKIAALHRDGTFIEYAIPTPDAKPSGIAVDELGRVWFAERNGNKIGVIERGVIREYPLPRENSGPLFVLPDRNGRIWFSQLFGSRIGALDAATGAIVEYDLPATDAWPGGLAFDSQANLWFSLQLKNKVGVILRQRPDEKKPAQAQHERHAAASH